MCKFGRKFTSALLALALFVSLLPIGAAPAQAEGLTIEINSGSDLLYFIRDLGSGNEGYADANVVLTANISVGDFFPIGYYAPQSPVVPFTGTFDGNGHTISGNLVGIDNENFPVNKVGIIAVLGSAGIVKNLNVTCSVSGRVDGNVGGIVGENNGGTVTNCTFSGSVSGSGNVGGIVGQNNGGSVTDCTNSGGVSGKGNVGGVVGDNSGSVTNCTNDVDFGLSGSGNNFGGVVGNNSGSVTGCSNNGRISVPMTNPPSSASGNLGGVVGQNSGADARITSCYNTGDLCNDFPSGSFDGNLGGVVGNNSDNSSVTNSYNTGTIGVSNVPLVSGTVGGVVGSNSGNSSVTNCYDSGKFGSFINSTVGGVIGSNTDTSNVTNCYFLQQDNVPAQGIGSGETTGATPVDDLTKQEQFSDWDFANIWRISQSLGFPVLQENAQDGLPPGLGTEASPYRISTADELKSFRDIVNDVDGNADGNPAAHAELMNDIDLSSICNETNPWEPIGNGGGTSGGNTFEGYFDGQGHSVKNLVVGL